MERGFSEINSREQESHSDNVIIVKLQTGGSRRGLSPEKRLKDL